MPRLQITRVGVVCLGLGAAMCLGYGYHLASRQSAIRHWPSAPATVLHFDPGVDPCWGGHWYANPRVTFEYHVGGKRFVGDRLNPSPFNYQNESRFEAETSHLYVGASVRCWFNPDDPTEAYLLNTGVTNAPRILIGCGILCGVVMMMVTWVRLRAGRVRALSKA